MSNLIDKLERATYAVGVVTTSKEAAGTLRELFAECIAELHAPAWSSRCETLQALLNEARAESGRRQALLNGALEEFRAVPERILGLEASLRLAKDAALSLQMRLINLQLKFAERDYESCERILEEVMKEIAV